MAFLSKGLLLLLLTYSTSIASAIKPSILKKPKMFGGKTLKKLKSSSLGNNFEIENEIEKSSSKPQKVQTEKLQTPKKNKKDTKDEAPKFEVESFSTSYDHGADSDSDSDESMVATCSDKCSEIVQIIMGTCADCCAAISAAMKSDTGGNRQPVPTKSPPESPEIAPKNGGMIPESTEMRDHLRNNTGTCL